MGIPMDWDKDWGTYGSRFTFMVNFSWTLCFLVWNVKVLWQPRNGCNRLFSENKLNVYLLISFISPGVVYIFLLNVCFLVLLSFAWIFLSFQVTSCEHAFCKACLIDYAASLGQVSCPSCSTLLTVDLTAIADNGNQTSKTTIKGFRASSILNRVQLDNFQTSTKIEALVCIILINHVLSLNSLVHVTMFYVYLIGMLLRDLTSIHVYSLF